MSSDARVAPRVVIVAALALERASLRRAQDSHGWLVVQSGPGPERAASSAIKALASGARALLSWGLVGALDVALAPGTVLVPRHVRRDEGKPIATDAAWQARLASVRSEFAVSEGDLLTMSAPLASPAAKARAASASGAVAVDMEAAAVAAAAELAGVPFAALRVVVDTLGDTLPGTAEQWIDERGNQKPFAALRAIATPSDWRPLWILAQRYRVARGVLSRLARVAATRDLLTPPSFAPRRASA